jgi:hypothetical protein
VSTRKQMGRELRCGAQPLGQVGHSGAPASGRAGDAGPPSRPVDPSLPEIRATGSTGGLRPVLAECRRCQRLAANCSRRPRSAVPGWYPAAQMPAAYRSTSMWPVFPATRP